jgi:hypothetical protein
VDVDRPVQDPRIVQPADDVDQVVPTEDATCSPHERVQQAELGRGQAEAPIAQLDLHGVRIHHEARGRQDVLMRLRRAIPVPSTKLHADAGHQLTWAERLDDVVVCAEVEADHLVGVAAARREQHDRDVARLAEPPTDLEPVESGQHHVEEDEVESLRASRRERLHSVFGNDHPMPVARHVQAQQVANPGIVIDDEHGGHGRRAYHRPVTLV